MDRRWSASTSLDVCNHLHSNFEMTMWGENQFPHLHHLRGIPDSHSSVNIGVVSKPQAKNSRKLTIAAWYKVDLPKPCSRLPSLGLNPPAGFSHVTPASGSVASFSSKLRCHLAHIPYLLGTPEGKSSEWGPSTHWFVAP